MSRPFKKFFCDRPEVFLLPPIAFKIWMYHYTREGRERRSWPNRETICEALDISLGALKAGRKYLVNNGWLEQVGQRNTDSGEFCVPVFKVTRGTTPHRGSTNRPRSRVKKWSTVAGQKIAHEVDSKKEVEDYVAPCVVVARRMRQGRLAGTSQKAPVSLAGKIWTED